MVQVTENGSKRNAPSRLTLHKVRRIWKTPLKTKDLTRGNSVLPYLRNCIKNSPPQWYYKWFQNLSSLFEPPPPPPPPVLCLLFLRFYFVSETPCLCQLCPLSLLLLLLCIIKRAKTCVHYKNHRHWWPAVILHRNKTWYKQFIQPEAKDHQEQKQWPSLPCQYPKSRLS